VPPEDRRPVSVARYAHWLREEFGADALEIERNRYELASSKALLDIQGSAGWSALLQALPEWADEYLLKTKFPL
jgi:hypothetical protein